MINFVVDGEGSLSAQKKSRIFGDNTKDAALFISVGFLIKVVSIVENSFAFLISCSLFSFYCFYHSS